MIIYKIYNKINKKSYIGSSEFDFATRYTQGKWWKYTHSHHLKRAVERYGLEAFKVEICWEGECSKDELISLEKKFIDSNNAMIPNGYNLVYGGKASGKPKNVKTYELIDFKGDCYKIFNLKEFCRKQKLNYGAMLNMVSGLWPASQGFGLKGTDLSKIKDPNLSWRVKNVETGEVSEIKRGQITKWSKERGLNSSAIESVIYGGAKISQGWKLETTTENNTSRKLQGIKLVNENGESVEIDSIYKFCKDNGFDRQSFYRVIKGEDLSAHGWRLPCSDEEFKKLKSSRSGRSAKLTSPTGEIIEVKNVSAFCRENEVKPNSIFALLRGRINCTKGWTRA